MTEPDPHMCVRCQKAPIEPGRRKFCSDACADSYGRAKTKMRVPPGIPRKTYRIYDYRNG